MGSEMCIRDRFNDTTVTYTKDVTNDVVILDIAGPDGSQVITLPLNDFQF